MVASHEKRHWTNLWLSLKPQKGIYDEAALINSQLSGDDLIIHALNGLGPNFKDIAKVVRALDSPISFEELHDKLVEHETFLKRRITIWVYTYYNQLYSWKW